MRKTLSALYLMVAIVPVGIAGTAAIYHCLVYTGRLRLYDYVPNPPYEDRKKLEVVALPEVLLYTAVALLTLVLTVWAWRRIVLWLKSGPSS